MSTFSSNVYAESVDSINDIFKFCQAEALKNQNLVDSMESELELAETEENQAKDDLQNGILQIDQLVAAASQSCTENLQDLFVQQAIEIEKAEFLANVMVGLDKYRTILMSGISKQLNKYEVNKESEPSETSALTERTGTARSQTTSDISTINKTGDVNSEGNEEDDLDWNISTEFEIQKEMISMMTGTQEVFETTVEINDDMGKTKNEWQILKELCNRNDSSDDDVIIEPSVKPDESIANSNHSGLLCDVSLANPESSTASSSKMKNDISTNKYSSSFIASKQLIFTPRNSPLSNSTPIELNNSSHLQNEKRMCFAFKKKTASGLKMLPLDVHDSTQ